MKIKAKVGPFKIAESKSIGMSLSGETTGERVCYNAYAKGKDGKWSLFAFHHNLDHLRDILSCPFTPEFKPKEGVGKALFKKILSAYPQGFWPNEKELAV